MVILDACQSWRIDSANRAFVLAMCKNTRAKSGVHKIQAQLGLGVPGLTHVASPAYSLGCSVRSYCSYSYSKLIRHLVLP